MVINSIHICKKCGEVEYECCHLDHMDIKFSENELNRTEGVL